MLLEIKDGIVTRGGHPVLSHFDFAIRGTEHMGIVGRNGAGKTTLLEVLAGVRELDSNEKDPSSGLFKSRQFSVAMLTQKMPADPEKKLNEWIDGNILQTIEKNADDETARYSEEYLDLEQRYDRMLTEFGILKEWRERPVGSFSGGELRKIQLTQLLLSDADVLILDEPTNHLDLDAVEGLETYLNEFKGAAVTVSHDRFFLDQTCREIWEISDRKLVHYNGNYSEYRTQRQETFARQEKAYEHQQQEIRHLNELIERFKHKPRKAAFARSRRKMLERMEKIPKPVRDEAVIHTDPIVPEKMSGKTVVSADHLVIGYDHPLHELSFKIRRGRKIGVIGPNGAGKSTLLKTIAGRVTPFKGKISMSERTDWAYFDQLTAEIHSEKNVFDWFHDRYPSLQGKDIRSYLAGYLFKGEDMGKKVSSLSGGEKTRLVLASILWRRPNFLILDEPTNNMDIPACETLESIFRSYQGTILFVSHDRYFVSQVADSLFIFGAENEPVLYDAFGYRHYLDQRKKKAAGLDLKEVRTAEEQKMIEDLRAVPKKGNLMGHQLSTEEAERDWRFELNHREREKAEESYAKAEADFYAVVETEKEYRDRLSSEQEQAENLQILRDRWTQACLQWYDIWQESSQF